MITHAQKARLAIALMFSAIVFDPLMYMGGRVAMRRTDASMILVGTGY